MANFGYTDFILCIYHIQVIDAYLWSLAQQSGGNVLAAEAYTSQIVQNNSSTRRTWSGISFTGTTMIIFPINLTGNHWTLLVSVKVDLHIY